MVVRQLSRHRSEQLAQFARTMRHSATASEEALWRSLSGSKLGVSFKRQVVVGGRFIVDFLASSAKLAVEVDGPYHSQRIGRDASRQRALERLGYRVLRLEAELVLQDLPAALEEIRKALVADP